MLSALHCRNLTLAFLTAHKSNFLTALKTEACLTIWAGIVKRSCSTLNYLHSHNKNSCVNFTKQSVLGYFTADSLACTFGFHQFLKKHIIKLLNVLSHMKQPLLFWFFGFLFFGRIKATSELSPHHILMQGSASEWNQLTVNGLMCYSPKAHIQI